MIVSIDCVAMESNSHGVAFLALNVICHMSDHFWILFRSSWRATESAGCKWFSKGDRRLQKAYKLFLLVSHQLMKYRKSSGSRTVPGILLRT